ncbi:hypothetical protein Tco_1212791 [Tanacetum coccineum]
MGNAIVKLVKKVKKLEGFLKRRNMVLSDSEEEEPEAQARGTKIPINHVSIAMKSPSIATYKIIKQGEKGVYQIVKEDGTDIVYINFGAILKDISRDDITELYRIVMNRNGTDGPEDELEKVFWKYLKNMFEEPLSTGFYLEFVSQQRIIRNFKRGENDDEDCYNLGKCIEKQDRSIQDVVKSEELEVWMEIRRMSTHQVSLQELHGYQSPWNLPFLGAKGLTSPEQTATVEMVFSRPWTCTFLVAKGLTTPKIVAAKIKKRRLEALQIKNNLKNSIYNILRKLKVFKVKIKNAFSDSDYAKASLDRKSTTGGCQFLGKRLISWQCKKQTIVANSTTEAEYVVADYCLCVDSTICIVKNPVFHSKTKHIEIRHHFIRDSYKKKLIQVIKIHIDHNGADLLTKAFDVSRIKKPIIVPSSYQPKKTHKPRTAIRTTEISQSSGPINLVTNETVYKEWEDRMERAASTTSSLDAEQDSGSGPRCQDTILGGVDAQTSFETTFKKSNDPPLLRGYTHRSGEDSMKLLELMELCTKLSDLVSKKKREML